jgi:purine catabolism regulator
MITTADGRLLSEAGDPGQRSLVRASRAFHPSGRFRTEESPEGLHKVDGLPGSHAVVAIKGGRIDHGRLAVFHPERMLTGSDLAVLERAATVAAVSLTKEIAITAVESKYRGDFLRDVLAGRGPPRCHHARPGWTRLPGMVVAALETENAPPMTKIWPPAGAPGARLSVVGGQTRACARR